MKKYMLIPLLALLMACGNRTESIKNEIKQQAENITNKVEGKDDDESKAREEKLKKPENLKLSYFAAVDNRQSEFMIIPVKLDYIVRPKDGDENLYSNLLFYNPNNGQINYMDTSYVGFIEHYEILTSQKPQKDEYGHVIKDQYSYVGKNANNRLIFMQIANSRIKTARTSSDKYGKKGSRGSYEEDTHYLAAVRDDGSNFVPLTPIRSSIRWWRFIQEGKGLLASATVDSDNNGKIEDSDKIQLFYTDLSNPALGNNVVPAGVQDLLIQDFVKRKADFDKQTQIIREK